MDWSRPGNVASFVLQGERILNGGDTVTLNERLQDVLEQVFGDPGREAGDNDGPGTVEGWDSLNHMNLILSIEAEFGVEFDTAEIPELLTVGKIRSRLAELA